MNAIIRIIIRVSKGYFTPETKEVANGLFVYLISFVRVSVVQPFEFNQSDHLEMIYAFSFHGGRSCDYLHSVSDEKTLGCAERKGVDLVK